MGVQLPSDELATQADLDALDQRVTTLEGGSSGDEESPDGHTIEDETGKIVMEDGTVITLTAASGQCVFDDQIDQTTRNVITGLKWDGLFYQENTSHNWYEGSYQTWSQVPGDPRNPPQPTGKYHVKDGRIIDPNGNRFRGVGVNCNLLNWPDNRDVVMGAMLKDLNACTPLLSVLPHTNMVRILPFLSVYQTTIATPDVLCPFIDALRRKNIVVEIEAHIYPDPLTGNDLQTVCNWFKPFARRYKDDSGVWAGTQNEPGGTPDDQIRAIYSAWRGEGNNNPIVMCPWGCYSWQGMQASKYADLYNVIWDLHCYGWMANFSTDQWTVSKALSDMIHAGDYIRSADGKIPVMILEFGTCGYSGGQVFFDSHDNQSVDVNWQQVLTAVYESPDIEGWTQYTWNTPNTTGQNKPDHGNIDLLMLPPFDGSGGLTNYGGLQCKDAIARAGSLVEAEATMHQRYHPKLWERLKERAEHERA